MDVLETWVSGPCDILCCGFITRKYLLCIEFIVLSEETVEEYADCFADDEDDFSSADAKV